MIAAILRGLGWAALAMLALPFVLAAIAASGMMRMSAERLDLGEPVGFSTGRQLAALGNDFPACRAALDRAGLRYTALPPRRDGASCGYDDAVRLARDDPRTVPLAPANVGISCPVAAALAVWEWNVVRPAARRHLGRRIAAIEHFGSYSCRRLYGRDSGSWSEHATADAIDIAAFQLEGGGRVSVVNDWTGDDAEARFLREVRDGACDVFATVLSPEYNAAHRDHFHLDQADRAAGWRACR